MRLKWTHMRLQPQKAWPPQKLPMLLSQVYLHKIAFWLQYDGHALIRFAPAMLPQVYEKLVLAPVSILPCCHTRSKKQLPDSTKPYALMANGL